MDNPDRRSLLRAVGTATALGVAGCLGGDDGGAGTPAVDASEYPAVDEWLTETEVGPAPDNYRGVLYDWTGRDAVTVDVGVEGNGGSFAYGPAAVVVSTGTTVRWNWTGEGNPHNVEAEPDDQIGRSDYEFSSGEGVGGSGVQYTKTLDAAGVALYHCEPHLSVGMKGAVAVE